MMVCDPEPLAGIEVYNGRTEGFRNQMAGVFAEHYGKIITSGSDFHVEADFARGGIETQWEILNSADLVRVLRSGEYSLITTD